MLGNFVTERRLALNRLARNGCVYFRSPITILLLYLFKYISLLNCMRAYYVFLFLNFISNWRIRELNLIPKPLFSRVCKIQILLTLDQVKVLFR